MGMANSMACKLAFYYDSKGITAIDWIDQIQTTQCNNYIIIIIIFNYQTVLNMSSPYWGVSEVAGSNPAKSWFLGWVASGSGFLSIKLN